MVVKAVSVQGLLMLHCVCITGPCRINAKIDCVCVREREGERVLELEAV